MNGSLEAFWIGWHHGQKWMLSSCAEQQSEAKGLAVSGQPQGPSPEFTLSPAEGSLNGKLLTRWMATGQTDSIAELQFV